MSMQSMPILGGLGACFPQKFLHLNALRLNLRAFSVVHVYSNMILYNSIYCRYSSRRSDYVVVQCIDEASVPTISSSDFH